MATTVIYTKLALSTWAQGEFIEAGGLMSYGPNFLDLYWRAADFVDKILRGAKPADIRLSSRPSSI